jgi:hypothetical protein
MPAPAAMAVMALISAVRRPFVVLRRLRTGFMERLPRQFGMLGYPKRRLDQALDAPHIVFLLRRRERYRPAFPAGSCRAPDTVHVVLAVFGQVIVYDKFYSRDVYSPRRYIGGYQYPVFSYLESFERFLTLVKAFVGMYFGRVVSDAPHETRYLRRAYFRARKKKHGTVILREYLG